MTTERLGNVLWIEDDHQTVDLQVEWLEDAGIDVHLVSSVDDAIDMLRSGGRSFDGVIIDIMMATGQFLKGEETNGGLKTGNAFLRRVDEEGLLDNYKWMIYTITKNEDNRDVAREFNIPIFRKQVYPGMDLVGIVKETFFPNAN